MTRRRPGRLAVLALVVVVGWRAMGRDHEIAVARLPVVAPLAAAHDRLIVEPDDGMTEIYALLRSPRRSLDMTMYELADPTAEAALAEDAARGVHVRVVLDGRLERTRNLPAYDYLRGRGVAVTWSSPRFFATHEKAFVIDDATAVVMSLNLAAAYYATTRDAAVVDVDPRDVGAIESVFSADFDGTPIGEPAADDLVWSPGQSHADLVAMIDQAQRSVAVESEELSSSRVIDALAAAARRRVAVSIAMTYRDTWRPAFARLAALGCRIALMYGERPRYLHAKLLVTDAETPRARAFVGSENLSDMSLLRDRELGIVLLAPPLVGGVERVISTDISDGLAWRR